jgi:hypothetical protein
MKDPNEVTDWVDSATEVATDWVDSIIGWGK